jgi:deoxyribodipyrimidine photo-lyase
VAASRLTVAVDAPTGRGRYVLYWMTAQRRTRWNHALDHAISRARSLDLPLLVFEPLRAGYRWASDRIHQFVLDGMADNAAACAAAGVTYLCYVEPAPGAGRGLLAALAADAAHDVGDDHPGFFHPRMLAAAASSLQTRLELVDGSGVLPLRAIERAHPTAAGFRRAMQRVLLPHLLAPPRARPLSRLPRALRDAEIPKPILRRGPSATDLSRLPIDHTITRAPFRGGAITAARLRAEARSGASPYLHFGHISSHELALRALDADDFDPEKSRPPTGRRGWFGVSDETEAYLDELLTWRELAHSFAFHVPDHDHYDSLPGWARATLERHASDPRPHIYSLDDLAAARTSEPLWNRFQHQLATEGRLGNRERMLWGKQLLQWTRTPRDAFATLVELNNRFAVDGRDPNSYAGIAWILGRFDRPWGPERPIYGLVRYMSLARFAKKKPTPST